jgi:hypothetical protein
MRTFLLGLAKRRTLFGLVLAVTIFGTVYGFAATLNVGPSVLSAGNAAVSSCQASGAPKGTYGVSYDQTLGSYKVTSVSVTGIDPNCDGKTVLVTLTGSGNASLGTGSAVYSAAGANTQVALTNLSANPDARDVTGVSVAING